MPGYDEHMARDARLIILKALAEQQSYSLNETILTATLEEFGHTRSREWVRTQLNKLADIGAVAVTNAGSVMVAKLTQAGLDHVQLRSTLDGVNRPSPGV